MTVVGVSANLVWCEWYEGARRRIKLLRNEDLAHRGPPAPSLFDVLVDNPAGRDTTPFRAGDFVQHVSGGPILTVTRCRVNLVECEWSHEGRSRAHSFSIEELREVRGVHTLALSDS